MIIVIRIHTGAQVKYVRSIESAHHVPPAMKGSKRTDQRASAHFSHITFLYKHNVNMMTAAPARLGCLSPSDHRPFFGIANKSRPLTDSAMFPGKSSVIPVFYGSVERFKLGTKGKRERKGRKIARVVGRKTRSRFGSDAHEIAAAVFKPGL